MTVNTFYDFQFDPSTGDLDHFYYCTNEGRKEISLMHLFTRLDFMDNAPFSLTNLCKHYPNRVIIYAEQYSPYCEREWWSYSNYPLMSAYSRITKIFESHYGYTSSEPIRYNTPRYINNIFRHILPNGLDLLWFPSNVYDQIHVNEGSSIAQPDYLLLYPILFKKSGGIYYAYNPQLGITEGDFCEISFGTKNFLYDSNSVIKYSNPKCDANANPLRFPVYQVNELDIFRNIDLTKLNIGFNLNSIQGVYNA